MAWRRVARVVVLVAISGVVLFGSILGGVSLATAASDPTPGALAATAPPDESWNRTYGGISYDYAKTLVATSDGDLVFAGAAYSFSTGLTNSDAWVVRVDADDGAEVWNRTYGGSGNDVVNALVETSDGNLVFGGATNSPAGIDSDGWLVKVDATTGAELWNRTYELHQVFDEHEDETITGVAETPDGDLVFSGWGVTNAEGNTTAWLAVVDGTTGSLVWTNSYGVTLERAYDVVVTSDGFYAFAGQTGTNTAGGTDAWLMKVNKTGTPTWAGTYGGAGADRVLALEETNDGNLLMGGERDTIGTNDHDAWLIVASGADGTELWNRTYAESHNESAFDVVEATDGEYLFAGISDPIGAFNADAWVVAVDGTTGAEHWNQTFGGSDSDAAFGLVATADGGYAFAGQTDSWQSSPGDAWVLTLAGPFTEPVTVGNDDFTPTDPDGDGTFEDVDGDGDTDGLDVAALTRLLTAYQKGDLRLTPRQIAAFDFDGDGDFDNHDLVVYARSVGRR